MPAFGWQHSLPGVNNIYKASTADERLNWLNFRWSKMLFKKTFDAFKIFLFCLGFHHSCSSTERFGALAAKDYDFIG